MTTLRTTLLALCLALLPLMFGVACSPLEAQTAPTGAQQSPAPSSPLTEAEWEKLAATALFGPEDIAALRMSLPLLEPQAEAILDVWYGFVGSQPHLLASFTNAAGKPQGEYLGKVRKRFGQWILETAKAEYNAEWLAHAHEIGLRHHTTKKNRTDGADAAKVVPMRYLAPLTIPVVTTLRPFLESGDHTDAEVDAMQQAWFKSVLLQTTLWSQPYVDPSVY